MLTVVNTVVTVYTALSACDAVDIAGHLHSIRNALSACDAVVTIKLSVLLLTSVVNSVDSDCSSIGTVGWLTWPGIAQF